MFLTQTNSDIMSSKTEGEDEMSDWTTLECPECKAPTPRLSEIWLMGKGNVSIKGIMTCTRCGKEWPFHMVENCLRQIDIGLPGEQSRNLTSEVPDGIKEDIREAERANYAQCHKAAAAMCRRALQLALIDKGIEDKPLSQMISDATGLFDKKTFAMAISVKGFGDIGAHRKEKIEPEDATIAIYMTVKMLNELFC